jgi:hypothetical protein
MRIVAHCHSRDSHLGAEGACRTRRRRGRVAIT